MDWFYILRVEVYVSFQEQAAPSTRGLFLPVEDNSHYFIQIDIRY
jgi:hypothetical protein